MAKTVEFLKKEISLLKYLPHFLASLFFLEIAFNFLTINKQLMGGDLNFSLNYFLANRLFIQKNGWFHLNYYSPIFGGGNPVYADPNDMYFSLPQLFVQIFPDLYMAIIATFTATLFLSYFGFFSFLRRFQIHAAIASALSVAFALNGYIMAHWLVGHMGMYTYWIIPWFFWGVIVVYQSESFKEMILPVSVQAVLLALSIYGGGINIVLQIGVGLLTAALAIRLLKGPKINRVRAAGLLFPWLGAAFITASKVVANRDFMDQFPRLMINYRLSLKQLFWLLPRTFFDPALKVTSELPYKIGGAHEFGNYIGWTSGLILLSGLIWLIWKQPALTRQKSLSPISFFLVWTAVGLPIVLYLIMGWNIVWLFLKPLPILCSVQGTYRLLGLFPAVLLGLTAAFLDQFFKYTKKGLLVGVLCTVVVLDVVYYQIQNPNPSGINPNPLLSDISFPLPNPDTYEIKEWTTWGDGPRALAGGKGFWDVYNPVFRYGMTYSRLSEDKSPLYRFPDGTYNVTDPVAMVYPEHVLRDPWSRVPGSVNEEEVRRFLRLEKTGFYVSPLQKAANAISLLALLAFLGAGVISIWWRWRRWLSPGG